MLMFKVFCPLLCGEQIKEIQQHLKICKNKNHLNKYYFQCPYNPNHICSKNVFPIHKESCPDKKKEEKEDENTDNFDFDDLNDKNILFKKKIVVESKKEILLKKQNNSEKKKEKEKKNKINNDSFNSKNNKNLNFDIIDKNIRFNEEKEGSIYSEKTDISSDGSLKNMKKLYKKKVTFDKMVKVFVYEKELISKFQRRFSKKKSEETFIEIYNKFL